MVTLLAKLFIKEKKEEGRIRQAYGMLCGMVGILLNIFLFIGKFIAGRLSNSIAITADAFNNLSDAGASFVTLIGFKLAGAKPDPEHPFGHGRMEYVSGLIVAAAILLMAYELIRDSVGKIITPEDTEFSPLVAAILIVSILVKLYMAFYNARLGKKLNSAAMRATAMDSLSDTCATSVVFVASLIGYATNLHIDGYCGLLVGLFILYAGIRAAKDTLDPLLGQPPEDVFVDQIEEIVMSYPGICGLHDLLVHDYGPGRRMISLHVEVPSDGDILKIHDLIDNIENELRTKLGCDATIHMDPIVTSDESIRHLKDSVIAILKKLDQVITLHDFRVVEGATHTNLIFDITIPYKFHIGDEELIRRIEKEVWETLGKTYFVVIKIDKARISVPSKKDPA